MSAALTPPLATPVLFLIFNRPDTTRAVLAAIRRARPTRLYVAADGPRPGHPTDAATCAAARAVVLEGIDWPCEVMTQLRSHNLNCGQGPAAAISWFFEHEEAGIILEDDCVPVPSFFGYCRELLARYATDTRVMHIGGNNFSQEAQRPLPPGADSYYFSTQVNSWGWATWRRAWKLFDFHLTSFTELRQQGRLDGYYSSALETRYRLAKIAGVLQLPVPAHVWDYQWHFAVAANSGLCVVPAVNLVGNVGFGDQGTHTLDATDELANVPTAELALPLRHPAFVLADRPRDRQRFREFLLSRVTAKLRRGLARLRPTAAAEPVATPALTLVPASS
ncbi:nucleotide-diphospho-sugar transferase [Hymenobacter terricola]|uniref:nucleotide-diphospho-sugar transferase n=1 Tax=Hymenobacter terricola TaxID=2819236 RepID=UPI001B30FB9D|nr:nucleotide-diphospho-sugar transferase [Hymenobacter terricola]